MNNLSYTIYPLGDSALTVDFGNLIDADINEEVIRLSELLKAAQLTYVKDIVAAYSSITVYYDVVDVLQFNRTSSAYDTIKNNLSQLFSQEIASSAKPNRSIRIPVCFAEKYALDASDVARLTSLSFNEIIEIYTSKKYRVYMVGFLPGFAYMGEVDERISVPRKQEPRAKVEPGFVGIAGKQTGIYPLTSPGGWQILGRTHLHLFDKEREELVLLREGDEVEFFAITEDEFKNY